MKLKYTIPTIVLTLIIIQHISCKKFVQVVSPDTNVSAVNVYNSDATAAAVLTGIYTNMSSSGFAYGGITSMSLYPGLSADELSVFANSNITYSYYYTNNLTSLNTGGSDFWSNIYPILYVINSAIAGLTNNSTLTPAVDQQLMGEATFMRAFCYFYLVNLYGDVPLVTGTNYNVNESLGRTPAAQVWQQIISDLKTAQGLLSTNYLQSDVLTAYPIGSTQKVRPTKWAADALLARAYLYTKDWADAKVQADSVIGNTSLFGLDTLNGVFLANSTEAIWQLQPVNAGQNTQDAILFVIPSSGPGSSYPVYLNPILIDAFEPGDQRRVDWIDSVSVPPATYYYAFKYKVYAYNNSTNPPTEYEMVLRLGEQYLIRAEAEANQNDLIDADSDINVIRTRAGLAGVTANTQASVLAAIQHERQVELFTEWGHRWLDLKRTDSLDNIMSEVYPQKVINGTWNTDWQWYPIPLYDLQHNINLIQNIGY